MPARRADVLRGPAGSRGVSFLTFFFDVEGFVEAVLFFSGFGPMLIVDNPISLRCIRANAGNCTLAISCSFLYLRDVVVRIHCRRLHLL